MKIRNRPALLLVVVLLAGVGCIQGDEGQDAGVPAPAARLAGPKPGRLTVGELVLGTWLPAGLHEFRFTSRDQDLLAASGLNAVEWLQRAEVGGLTAEDHAMRFCDARGFKMPVFYEPPHFPPVGKLQNWATKAQLVAGFADSVAVRVRALQSKWGRARGFWGYLVGHEDYARDYYPALDAVVGAIAALDSQRPAITVGRLDHYDSPVDFADAFFRDEGPPNIFQHEHYVFKGAVPQRGKALQDKLSFLLTGYDQVAAILRGRWGRWHAIVQVQSEMRGTQLYYRKPTATEIEVQAGLALTRGASGIVYFIYSSGIETLSNEPDRVYEGLVDQSGQPTASYTAVQKINGRLRKLSPALAGLYYYGATGMQGGLVTRPTADLEFGYFGNDGGITHVLVVNRRTWEPRTVVLGIRGDEVRDAVADRALAVNNGDVEVALAAGGWRFLAVRSR